MQSLRAFLKRFLEHFPRLKLTIDFRSCSFNSGYNHAAFIKIVRLKHHFLPCTVLTLNGFAIPSATFGAYNHYEGTVLRRDELVFRCCPQAHPVE